MRYLEHLSAILLSMHLFCFSKKSLIRIITIVTAMAVVSVVVCASAIPDTAPTASAGSFMPWWGWPLTLFITAFSLGVVAVLGGIGGAVLFVPVVGAFFPFHLDFVRGAGLLIALTSALVASPGLLKKGMADLRIALPIALIASSASIAGALIGLALPSNILQVGLGILIFGIIALVVVAKKEEFPEVKQADHLSSALRIQGMYHDITIGHDINWQIHRTPQGFAIFVLIGFIAGMFGMGARWANVPVLNLVMGAPLKVSVATSKFLLSITDSSAAWIYLNNGAVLPLIAVPSILGILFGSVVGVRLSARARPASVRYMVVALLLLAGGRLILKGLGIWN